MGLDENNDLRAGSFVLGSHSSPPIFGYSQYMHSMGSRAF